MVLKLQCIIWFVNAISEIDLHTQAEFLVAVDRVESLVQGVRLGIKG